jgi:3-hydroxy-9,10-secoandrosta-1,3,5(10)-triene-9,17-dione monooxygenase reductase component
MTNPIPHDTLSYRKALGCFTTGVAIVMVDAAEGVVALTVNSFGSVSLEPRLVLWSLDERSERRAAFLSQPAFGVSVLGFEQQAWSQTCAEPGGGWWRGEAARLREGGAPVLPTALARFDCRTLERIPAGDHTVFLGEVVAFDQREGDGLTYFRGRYGRAPQPGLEG